MSEHLIEGDPATGLLTLHSDGSVTGSEDLSDRYNHIERTQKRRIQRLGLSFLAAGLEQTTSNQSETPPVDYAGPPSRPAPSPVVVVDHLGLPNR